MSSIAVPIEITVCSGDSPGTDDLDFPINARAAHGSGAFGRRGASPGLRRRAGRAPGGHEWAGARRGTRGASEAQLGSPGVFGRLRDMRNRGLITNEQCVALATAAVGIRLGGGGEGSHVSSWRRGEAAEAGELVAGTPVATFLDREGRTGNTYAIGGNGGQPGVGLDHAAVFQKYLSDNAGHRVGMEVSEQYLGSGGTHERAYYFKNGGGEYNASNYYVIDTPSGHLGGDANPLNHRGAIASQDQDQRRHYHAAVAKASKQASPAKHMGPFLPMTSQSLGNMLEGVDQMGDREGKRYAHEEWEAPGFSYKYEDGKGDEPNKFDPPEPRGKFDELLEPRPPKGQKPVPGIDTEPPEGLGRQGKTGAFDIFGPGGRLPEPENKSGQRYKDNWKPGGTEI